MMALRSWILSEANAGLRSQAIGLAEAAGLSPDIRTLVPRGLWRHVPAAFWPRPLHAIEPAALAGPWPDLLLGCGGKSAAVLAALKPPMRRVIIQHPRCPIRRFDLVVVARHDEVAGPNVIVTRTALHRITPARLAAAAAEWAPRLAHLPRPLVAVLVGASNGRFRLGEPEGRALADNLASIIRHDSAGVIVTPSRRTNSAIARLLGETLRPLGAEMWDGTGENPYFGMLALADAIVVTTDSVSMVSEAVATTAPVLLATLPGRSRRIGLFLKELADAGRTRPLQDRLELWPVAPINDTQEAADEMRQRLGL